MTQPTNNSYLCGAFQGTDYQPAPKPAISPLRYDISSYLPLVQNIAHCYHIPASSCLQPADLIQEGYLGLHEAQKLYDPNQASFETYASKWIHKFIADAVHRYRSAVSYPPSHPFTDDDCTIPLDKPVSSPEEEGDATLADTIADTSNPTPEQRLINLQDEHILRQAIATLTPREQLILTRLYGLDGREPATVEALATALAVSHWAIHKLRERALRKLRKNPSLMSNFRPKPVYT